MAENKITAGNDWPAVAQYVASGATDILLPAPVGRDLVFMTGAVAPTVSPAIAPLIRGGNSQAMQLADGEGLFVVAFGAAPAEAVDLVILD